MGEIVVRKQIEWGPAQQRKPWKSGKAGRKPEATRYTLACGCVLIRWHGKGNRAKSTATSVRCAEGRRLGAARDAASDADDRPAYDRANAEVMKHFAGVR